MNPEEAAKASIRNKGACIESHHCGCYYCLNTFDPKKIEIWLPDAATATAVCPECGIDSVLPNSPTQDDLIACHERWFQ